jgi:hypothetical protein
MRTTPLANNAKVKNQSARTQTKNQKPREKSPARGQKPKNEPD